MFTAAFVSFRSSTTLRKTGFKTPTTLGVRLLCTELLGGAGLDGLLEHEMGRDTLRFEKLEKATVIEVGFHGERLVPHTAGGLAQVEFGVVVVVWVGECVAGFPELATERAEVFACSRSRVSDLYSEPSQRIGLGLITTMAAPSFFTSAAMASVASILAGARGNRLQRQEWSERSGVGAWVLPIMGDIGERRRLILEALLCC